MLQSGDRRMVKPSVRSVVFSLAVALIALVVARYYFPSDYYVPVASAIVVSLGVTWFMHRRLRPYLPAPYGEGKTSSMDAASTMRSGLLLIVGGIVCLIGVFGSVYLLPPPVYFSVIFGLMIGLPLAELFYFGLVNRLERSTMTKIYWVTEEKNEGDDLVLLKSVAMIHRHAGR